MIPKEYEFFPKFSRVPVEQTGDHDQRIERTDLSADQETALQALLEQQHDEIVTLGGYAGTGKSTLIPLFSEASDIDPTETAFAAFTGKAANVLQRKLRAAGRTDAAYVGTIHRLIYAPVTDDEGHVISWQRQNRPLVAERPDHSFVRIQRIIIDEASMVGEQLMQDLEYYEIPILAVGDHGQLLPVKDHSVITEPDIRLEKIHRQAANNPIIQLASVIREEGDIPKHFPESEEIRFVSKDNAYEVIGETYERLGLNMSVLVRRNLFRKQLNTLPRERPEPEPGDLVICLKNSPPVYNGMRGLIQTIEPYRRHWYRAEVLFPDDGLVVKALLNRHQFGRERTLETRSDLLRDGIRYPDRPLGLLFDFGMALTVHKAQGSGFDEVILYPERWTNDRPSDYQRWIYTAVTRAAKRLTIVRDG